MQPGISRWDVTLAASLLSYALLELFVLDLGGPAAVEGQVAFAVLATVPLAWRRRAPLVVLAVVAGSFGLKGLVYHPLPELLSEALAYLVAIYGAAYASPRRTAIVAGLAALALAELRLVGHDVDVGENVVNVGFALAGWMGGRAVRRLEARAQRSERTAEAAQQETREAVADERARIARELHDIVAHGIGVMVLQARGGRRVLHGEPERARTAFDTIEQAGEQALAEMRRLLEVLRDADQPPGPQPGLAQIEELAERTSAAGVAVEVRTHGRPVPLAPGLELCAFRIVQEALTNCLKHARATRASVDVSYGNAALEVRVQDDGSGTGARGAGTGHGLIGMRERVALFDGALDAGPAPGGGYGVRARFPLEAG